MNIGEKTHKNEKDLHEQKRLYNKVCYSIVRKDRYWDILVIEYKSADKLTPAPILERLHDMDIDAIIYWIKIPKNKAKKQREIAKEAIAIVVIQIYNYIIEQGLSYSYINRGKSFLFLFVYLEELETLYYEKFILEDPSTTSSIISDEKLQVTAIRLVAGFAQMAWNQQSQEKACQRKLWNPFPTWIIDNGKIMNNITPISIFKGIKESFKFEESKDLYTFLGTSLCQTYSRAKAKKDLVRCQKNNSILAKLRNDDDNLSGKKDYTHFVTSESNSLSRGKDY